MIKSHGHHALHKARRNRAAKLRVVATFGPKCTYKVAFVGTTYEPTIHTCRLFKTNNVNKRFVVAVVVVGLKPFKSVKTLQGYLIALQSLPYPRLAKSRIGERGGHGPRKGMLPE